MLEQFSKEVVNSMIECNCIEDSDREKYVYGLICLSEYCISMSAILIIGIWAGKFLATLFFLLLFIEIKKRCGGLHANTYFRCLSGTCIIYLVFVLYLADFMLEHMQWTLLSVLISFLILELIGAVKHPAVGWSEEEYSESIAATRIVVLLQVWGIYVLYYLNANEEIVIYSAFAVCLNAALLAISKVKEMLKNERN